MTALMHTYNQLPVRFTHGQGVTLYDEQGKAYLDGLAGIAVNCLGHAHPALVKTICEQAQKLIHVSNVYEIPNAEACAQKLVTISGMDKVFFCSTGAEATECMMKLARKYGHDRGNMEPTIIVMEKAFHGRTIGAITASGSRKVQAGFEPLLPGFVRAPYNDLKAIENIAKNNHNIVAVMVEPVQGEGGVIVPSPDYLPGLRQICDQQGWLLMLDEVQSAVGRTGQWFAFQQYPGLMPDVIAMAKGLAGGLPIGACLARGAVADTFAPGNHGSTFGGNPLCTAAALCVIDTIEKEGLLKNAERVGQYFLKRLREEIAPLPHVKDVRGQGLWLGIEMDAPARPFLQRGLDEGILFSVTGETVIRFAPPMIFTETHVDTMIEKLKKILA